MRISVTPEMLSTIRYMTRCLAHGEYDLLEGSDLIAVGSGGGLTTTPQEVARAVKDYGATITELPDGEEILVRPEQWIDSAGRSKTTLNLRAGSTLETRMYGGRERVHLEVPLWTLEGGRSNLMMNIFVAADAYRPVQIDDLQGCPPKLVPAIRNVVHQLVIGDHEGAVPEAREFMATAADLAEQMRRLADDQGLHFTTIPDAVFMDCVSVYPADDDEYAWAVDVKMWTVEHGLSDWTLQLDMQETEQSIQAWIRDLHIL